MKIPAALLVLALAACASSKGEMDQYLDEQVGKAIDDPQSFRVQQQDKRVYTYRPRNGRTVEEYRVGFRDQCQVFLELDDQQRKIAAWRLGRDDADCYMSPNVGR